MKRGFAISLVLFAAVALSIGIHLRDGSAPDSAQLSISDTPGPVTSGSGEVHVEAAAGSPEESPPGEQPGQAISFEQMAREVYDQSIMKTVQAFRADLQALVREAELLPAQDYETRARELLARVDRLAAGGYLTGPEALALRLSLLKYVLPPDDYRNAANNLVGDAQQLAEQAEREWAARSDPKLERYRAEERRIVEQSATMNEFPDGMTRQAYLREKLRDLRSEIYSQ